MMVLDEFIYASRITRERERERERGGGGVGESLLFSF